MDETMKNGVEEEITTVSEDYIQDDIDETSGPSKGFVALVVGGIAAVAIGAAVAIKRHKKKKTDEVDEDFEDDAFDGYVDEDIEEEFDSPEEKSEKPAEEK